MNRLHATMLTLLVALAWMTTPASAEEKARNVRVDIQMFRVLGGFSGDLSLTDDIWSGIDGPELETKRAFTFFTTAKAQLADVGLTVDDRGWIWNDVQSIPFGEDTQNAAKILGDRVTLLATPAVLVPLGSSATIVIAGDQNLQYFERVHDNTFELKTMQQSTGMTFRMEVEEKEPGRILLKDLTVQSRIIEERKPIEGVALNVGEPILKTREFKASMNLQPGRDYGILMHVEDMGGLLLIRLRVEFASPLNEPAN